jgi:hypothetical protein
MNADATDFTRYLAAAFDALGTRAGRGLATFGGAAARADGATPTPLRLAMSQATFARARPVRGTWNEALHPRGRLIPDIRGRINRGEFGNKPRPVKPPKKEPGAGQAPRATPARTRAAAQKSPTL